MDIQVSRGASAATDARHAVAALLDAQQRVLDRYRVTAQRAVRRAAGDRGTGAGAGRGRGPAAGDGDRRGGPGGVLGPADGEAARSHPARGRAALRDVLLAAGGMPTYTPSLLALVRAVMRWTRPRPAIVTTADQLRGIGHPVRLVWGQQDPCGRPGTGRRIADLIPAADLHVVPGGHAPWLHHADIVAGLTHELLQAQR